MKIFKILTLNVIKMVFIKAEICVFNESLSVSTGRWTKRNPEDTKGRQAQRPPSDCYHSFCSVGRTVWKFTPNSEEFRSLGAWRSHSNSFLDHYRTPPKKIKTSSLFLINNKPLKRVSQGHLTKLDQKDWSLLFFLTRSSWFVTPPQPKNRKWSGRLSENHVWKASLSFLGRPQDLV